VVCFLASSAAFLFGFVTEWRQAQQTRRGEPVAIVATLPFAVMAAILLAFGLIFLPIPWWIAPIGLAISIVVFGKLITRASANDVPEETNQP